jgi:hypothetical protein
MYRIAYYFLSAIISEAWKISVRYIWRRSAIFLKRVRLIRMMMYKIRLRPKTVVSAEFFGNLPNDMSKFDFLFFFLFYIFNSFYTLMNSIF